MQARALTPSRGWCRSPRSLFAAATLPGVGVSSPVASSPNILVPTARATARKKADAAARKAKRAAGAGSGANGGTKSGKKKKKGGGGGAAWKPFAWVAAASSPVAAAAAERGSAACHPLFPLDDAAFATPHFSSASHLLHLRVSPSREPNENEPSPTLSTPTWPASSTVDGVDGEHSAERATAAMAWSERPSPNLVSLVEFTRILGIQPSNSPHDQYGIESGLVGSHGRWKRPCLQTNPRMRPGGAITNWISYRDMLHSGIASWAC